MVTSLIARPVISLFIVALMLCGCAEVAPPPGGEIDKTSPKILSSMPPNGATSVSPGTSITIQFSEHIATPAGRGVYISPRPSQHPKIKWKGNRLEITLDSAFAPAQTYVVSLMRGVVDLRGNQIDSLAQVAFSTGLTIDSGRISGTVDQGGKPAVGVCVGLFAMNEVSQPSIVWDSLYPIYLTTTDKAGAFDLRYLPSQEFALVAFADANRNERIGVGVEPVAIPDRKVISSDGTPKPFALKMMTLDTAAPQVLSATWTSDRLLRIRLARPLFVRHPRFGSTSIALRSATDSAILFHSRGILESDSLTTVVTATFDQLPLGKYQIEFIYDTLQPALEYTPLAIDSAEDKTPPRLNSFSLANQTLFTADSPAVFSFTEPIDRTPTLDSAFVLIAGEDSPQIPGGNWVDPFHYRMKVGDFEDGRRYRAAVNLAELRDRSGNPCGDSVLEFSFTRMNSDSLGTISGLLEVDTLIAGKGRSRADIMLTFTRVGFPQHFDLRVAHEKFSISLPGGKYVVTTLVDRDGNGVFTGGRLTPYSLSETISRHPDTVAVRPRFETSGITIQVR